MENRFTQKAKSALLSAAEQAMKLGSTYIGSEHLLLGILETDGCIGSEILVGRGASYIKVKKALTQGAEKRKRTVLHSSDISPRLRKII